MSLISTVTGKLAELRTKTIQEIINVVDAAFRGDTAGTKINNEYMNNYIGTYLKSLGWAAYTKNTLLVKSDAPSDFNGSDSMIFQTAQQAVDAIPTIGANKPTAINPYVIIGDPTIDISAVDWTAHIAAGTEPFITIQNVQGGGSSNSTVKQPVRVATTVILPDCIYNNAAKTLTGNANGALAAQDEVTLVAGDSLLVKDQATGLQNGIYTVTQIGTSGTPFILTRRVDANSSKNIVAGMLVPVIEGNLNSGLIFVLKKTGVPITVGTTSLSFSNNNGIINALFKNVWSVLANVSGKYISYFCVVENSIVLIGCSNGDCYTVNGEGSLILIGNVGGAYNITSISFYRNDNYNTCQILATTASNGVFYCTSDDIFQSFSAFTNISTGLSGNALQVKSSLYDSVSAQWFIGTSDKVYKTSQDLTGFTTWIISSTGMSGAGFRNIVKIIRAGAYLFANDLGLYVQDHRIWKSSDNGANWGGIGSIDTEFNEIFYENSKLWGFAQSKNQASYSTDYGGTWTNVKLPEGNLQSFRSFGNTWFANIQNKGLFVSTDNGGVWELRHFGIAESQADKYAMSNSVEGLFIIGTLHELYINNGVSLSIRVGLKDSGGTGMRALIIPN